MMQQIFSQIVKNTVINPSGPHRVARLAMVMILALSASATHGQSGIDPTTITRIALNDAGYAFIEASSAHPLPGAPGCSTSPTWHYVFSSTSGSGPARLAAALSAKLAATPVRLIGTGACLPGYNIEVLDVVDLK